jgi:4-hydroxybutyrate dehydrogenase
MALIYYVTQIQFDFGALQLLKSECARVGISKPLLVTDQGVKAAGIVQKALDVLATRLPPIPPKRQSGRQRPCTGKVAATA